MLFVIVEDFGDRLYTGVFLALVVFSGALLVPIENTTDEGRDEGDASLFNIVKRALRANTKITYLCTCNCLAETKEQGQVAVNAFIALQFAGSLDTLPGGGNLDEDTLLVDTLGLVELDELLGLGLGGLLVKGQAGINLGRDAARYNFEDLCAKCDKLMCH